MNFASNDYLGLSQHPSVKAAAKAAIDRFGAGSGASRLVTGTQYPHTKFEEEIAAFKGTESALLFSTGYAAAIGTITSLVGPGDVVILDKLCARVPDRRSKTFGCYLASISAQQRGEVEASPRLGPEKAYPQGKTLIVTESIFSMDGDFGDLARLLT